MKIALVVGHRSGNQGAYGNMGISEYEFWNKFLDDIWDRLPKKHKCQRFLRANDVGGYGEEMEELHKRIDKFGAKISISFHFNGSSKESVTGFEVLYYSDGGKVLANTMIDCFEAEIPTRNRGAKKTKKDDRGGGFLSRGKSKCILIEPFFSLHQNDFVEGGRYRENLIVSILNFLKTV